MIVQFLDYQDLPWSLLIILSSLFITLPPGGGEQSREVGKSTSRRRHCLWTWLLYFLGLGEKGREGRWWNEWRDLPRPHFFSLFFPNHFCFPILLPIFHPAVSFRPLWNCLGPGLRMRKTHWSLPCLGNDYSPRGRGGGGLGPGSSLRMLQMLLLRLLHGDVANPVHGDAKRKTGSLGESQY